jgi:hypothetical protein
MRLAPVRQEAATSEFCLDCVSADGAGSGSDEEQATQRRAGDLVREATMAVPRPHTGPTADRDREWNWGQNKADETDALLDKGGWPLMVEAHAWYDDTDGDPPEKKSAYKLPHHELIDGQLQVVWSGVTAAMNVVAGGRGGSTCRTTR